ncbi:hypothetical protein VNO77_02910 [Canavalia gladiata]|uniref:Uncharacterized protein n=1 Tax=Canavalia gladiata TaxID=3824 RepID=A0AAN9N0B0_CANGL
MEQRVRRCCFGGLCCFGELDSTNLTSRLSDCDFVVIASVHGLIWGLFVKNLKAYVFVWFNYNVHLKETGLCHSLGLP